jgi:D-alanine-D-alanine ligase
MSINPKIIVITGGDSLESKSSITTAWNVISQIMSEDFDLFLVELHDWDWKLIWAKNYSSELVDNAEIDSSNLTLYIDGEKINFDAAFIAIHGYPGETGHLQAYLEIIKIPYTGSGIMTSAMAINKSITKKFLESSINIFTPYSICISKKEDLHLNLINNFSLPCIVKPNSYGSGIEVRIVNSHKLILEFIAQIHDMGQVALIEEFIYGREVTIGAIINNGEMTTLPLAEIIRPNYLSDLSNYDFFNFKDRQSVQIVLDSKFEKKISNRLYELTKKIGQQLECKDFFRVDYIVDCKNNIYFLEINTIPGMSEKSVFTKQLNASSYNLKKICSEALQRALSVKVSHILPKSNRNVFT